ncbi:hypothetical protein ACPPVO_08175 [Dactylosporangium sp. McL0621]|uniref:hypothetical protein n=1 Tax=Dactylosporangium sp. McL0621 TaxID=3415678 RepID=UPI003CF92176
MPRHTNTRRRPARREYNPVAEAIEAGAHAAYIRRVWPAYAHALPDDGRRRAGRRPRSKPAVPMPEVAPEEQNTLRRDLARLADDYGADAVRAFLSARPDDPRWSALLAIFEGAPVPRTDFAWRLSEAVRFAGSILRARAGRESVATR